MNTKKYLLNLCFICIPLLLFFCFGISFVFYNNDDLFLKQIASGELTGVPQTRLLYIGYGTGVVLSLLYTLLPAVPWYGIMLFCYGYFGLSLSTCAIAEKIEKIRDKMLFLTIMLLINAGFLWVHIMQVQYTTITAIVCASSLLCFYLSTDEENPKKFLKENILSLVLFLLSVELRSQACIMFVPTFFLLAAIKYLKNKKMLRSVVLYIAAILLLLTASFGTEKIAYSQNDWNSFSKFNAARQDVMDYSSYPLYETYEANYLAHGINEASYTALSTRYQILLEDNADTEFMTEMAELAPSSHPQFASMIRTFLERHTVSYTDRPLNLIVYVFYFFVILCIVISKQWSAFADLAALFIGRNIIWFYLLFINRPLPRVTQGIYIMELLMLAAIFCSNNLWKATVSKRQNVIRAIICIWIVCTILVTGKWGLPYAKSIADTNTGRLAHSSAYTEIRSYFYQNPDNLYLLDTNSFSYFTESIFAKTPESTNNFVLLGSWMANSPWTDSIAADRGISSYEEAAVNSQNVFFVFMNAPGLEYDYLNSYFESKYPGTYLTIADTYLCSNGIEFYILQISSERNEEKE